MGSGLPLSPTTLARSSLYKIIVFILNCKLLKKKKKKIAKTYIYVISSAMETPLRHDFKKIQLCLINNVVFIIFILIGCGIAC